MEERVEEIELSGGRGVSLLGLGRTTTSARNTMSNWET